LVKHGRFTYGVTETINYAKTVEDGISKIDEILNSEFGMEKEITLHPRKRPRIKKYIHVKFI
jgi:hypothetical protein